MAVYRWLLEPTEFLVLLWSGRASNSVNQILKMQKCRRNRIQWTSWAGLDDFDIADDLALLFHTQQQMQWKTHAVVASSPGGQGARRSGGIHQ